MKGQSISKATREHVIRLYIDLLKGRRPEAEVRREIEHIATAHRIDPEKLNELQNKAIDLTEDRVVRRSRYRGHRPHYQV